MKLLNFFAFILFISAVSKANGLKIFGVFPLGSKSHFSIGKSIVDALHDAKHDITVLSPFPLKNPKERYRDIDLSPVKEKFEKENPTNAFNFMKMPIFMMIPFMSTMGNQVMNMVMEDESVKNFIKSGEKFDVCVIEIFFIEALLGMAEHFDCVLIGYTTYDAVEILDQLTGNISPTSYVPIPFLDYTDKMTFTERFWNTIYNQYEKIVFNVIQTPLNRYLYKKHFPNNQRSLDDLMKSVSIIFQNSHVSTSTPRPMLPKVVEICGAHVKPVQPLPNDLQTFLDSANEGVIVFTMGSFINSKDFPVDKRDAFVNAFGKLKLKVIWKYEEELPNKPGNIKISSWLPQRDILAHKNVKVFITHGGLLGTTEAMYEGVPLLGIPIFGDQKMNMKKAVTRGYGLQVDYDEITEEKISLALEKLINDPKYKETAKVLSKRFNDRPVTPQESIVYWTEYVYRHKGAKHLSAKAVDLNYIQLRSLDVYSVLLGILAIMIFISYRVTKFILRKLFQKLMGKQKKN